MQKINPVARPKQSRHEQLCLWVLCGALLINHDQASAAAFAIIEHSARGQGMAFAGGGAIAEDASAAWFNPAGIVLLDNQLQVSAHLVMPSFEFSDQGSLQLTPLGDLPLLPDAQRRDDGGETALVPNLYFVNAFSERFYLGIAVNAPFGLTTEYDDNWVGRYQALKSRMTTINVNPNLAWKINRQWSVALGVSVNYIDVELTNALDFAAICAFERGALCPNGALPGGGAFDGFVRNQGEDISLGANFGLLWASDSTRLSFTWRSQINHTLEGEADFSTPDTLGGVGALGGPLAAGLAATFADSDITADVSLPDSASFSLYRQLTPRLGLSGDLTWTDWADIQDISIRFDNPLTPTGIERLGFDSAWRMSLGLRYTLDDHWTFRTGAAFDESPTPDEELRSARLPDSDRRWLSFGVSYAFDSRYAIDFGYSHIFVKDASVRREGTTQDLLLGEYASTADIVSLQLNAKF